MYFLNTFLPDKRFQECDSIASRASQSQLPAKKTWKLSIFRKRQITKVIWWHLWRFFALLLFFYLSLRISWDNVRQEKEIGKKLENFNVTQREDVNDFK